MSGRGSTGWLRIALLGASKFLVALAVFAAAELLATRVLNSVDRMPLWLVLAATAVVALLFWLLHEPLGRLVDRLLLGERAGGYQAGRLLLQRMSTTLPVDEIAPALAETAGRTMHSARAEVRVLLSDSDPWSQVWPEQAVADGSPVTVGVRHAGAAVGEIEVDVADADEVDRDRMLLDDLARPAGLALSTVRLTVELRRRAVELEALTGELTRSYQRIAGARRTQIARMRAELQDRVMPHLDRAQSAIAQERGGTSVGAAANGAQGSDGSLIERARVDVAEALESLRSLARGIYPPRLVDAGLAVSLEGWQQRSGVAVDVQVRGDEAVLRENSELESCLYFCLVTALSTLPAGDRRSRPTAVLDIGPAEVALIITGSAEDGSVVDDTAMMVVRDRVEAFGGRVGISTRDAATSGQTDRVDTDDPVTATVRAWIPLAAQPPGPVAAAPAAGLGGESAMTIRVVLAEDNFLLREGVRGMLAGSESIDVVGSCGDLPAALESIDTQVPDVVLTDIRMPPDRRDEGIVIAAHCRRRFPTMGVVLLSQYAEASYVRTLLTEGTQGRGYLLKERVADLDDLIAAIRAVAAGGSAIDPKVVETLVTGRSLAGDQDLARLTPREREVLAGIAQGRTNAAIAAELFLTQHAVEKHINAIFTKLGLSGDRTNHPRVRATLLYLAEGQR